MTKINLQKFRQADSKIYSGRNMGIDARKILNLNKLDKSPQSCEVIIPRDTWAINSSFFGGLFEESVIQLGEIEFRKKYHFIFDNGAELSPELESNINEGIYDALNEL